MDLFGRGKILLTGCSLLVIDEADRMLDMGFIPDIEEICTKLPKQRQTLLFSATMPAPIKKLADKFLDNPKMIEVARPATTATNIKQYVVPVAQSDKRGVLRDLLREAPETSAIIFCNRKTTVRELNKSLKRSGFRTGEIHGDMDQSARIAELDLFKAGEIDILVASDVAARGLDVKGVSHVFNFDAPWHPDDYVHRVGRTGRAGASGIAYTFVTPDDAENIDNIEKLTGQKIERLNSGAAARADTPADEAAKADEKPKRRSRAKAPVRQDRARRGADDAPEARAEKTPEPRVEKTPEARAERSSEPRAARPARRDRPAERPARDSDQNQGETDNGWNGPMPGFLSVKLTD